MKTCKCGHDRSHFMVTAEGRYTALGWFWVLFGITTQPIEVLFKCRKCGEIFDRTTEPAVLEKNQ